MSVHRDEALAAWIRLSLVAGLGGVAFRKLLAEFGPPSQVFAAGRDALAHSVGASLANRILASDAAAAVEQTLRWVTDQSNTIVTLADATYPQQLLEIHDPPPLLYVCGDATLLQRRSIAIVGSRNATAQGIANAGKFARALSEAGVTVVSGLALGIDTAAHHGALAGAASTIAVLGCGIDVVYPERNADLFAMIAARGVLLSEFPLATPPIATNFPRRNRVISGLARGVLVVEATVSSGSLITARLAAEQGREVFAVPGSIHSPLAKGCHALIKEGAKLAETSEDILGEFGIAVRTLSATRPQREKQHELLRHLGYDPCNVDILSRLSGLTPETVSAMLLELELEGIVASLPGGQYQRIV